MLRRNKKKEQQAQHQLPPTAAAPATANVDTSPTASPADYRDHPTFRNNNSSTTNLSNRPGYLRSSSDLLRHDPQQAQAQMSASSSTDMMPPPPHPKLTGSSSSLASQQQHNNPPAKSHGALNFFFSKAKNSFGSNQSAAHDNARVAPSNSAGSLASLEEQQEAGPSSSSANFPPSRPSIGQNLYQQSPYGSHDAANVARSSSSDFRQQHLHYSQHPPRGLAGGRPSFDVDVASQSASPTKKGFFSRERKGSTATTGSASRYPFGGHASKGGHSPLASYSRGGGGSIGSAGSISYGQYSKSQSDLHSGPAEFPSPLNANVDLPPVPALPQNIPTAGMHDDRQHYSNQFRQHQSQAAAQQQYLRSPSPADTMSRSVEDTYNGRSPQELSSPHGLGLRSPSPQPVIYSSSPSVPGATWGEHGVPAPSWGRPSDLATMRQTDATTIRGNGARSPGLTSSRPENIPFSGQSQATGWIQRGPSPSPEPGTSGHTRKNSRLTVSPDGFFGGTSPTGTGRSDSKKNVASGLATSFSLGQVAAGASNVMEKLRGPTATSSGGTSASHVERQASMDSLVNNAGAPPSVVVPSGASHVGFLNRNGNITLALSQLGGGREKEKDIQKGWKPYKAVVKDGSLLFFKPPSGVNEEVKGVFPTTALRNQATSSRHGLQPLDAEALKQSGLKTQDLLQLTSSSSSTSRSPPSSPTKRNATMLPSLSTETPSLTGVAQMVNPDIAALPAADWRRPGKHADLELVSSPQCPPTWPGRIVGGSFDALIHELISASQKRPDDDPHDTGTMIHTVLFASIVSGRSMAEILSAMTVHLERALQVSVSAPVEGANSLSFPTEDAVNSYKADVQSRAGWIFDVLLSHHADAMEGDNARLLEALATAAGPLAVDVPAALRNLQVNNPRPLSTDWSTQKPDQPRPKLASLVQNGLSGSDLLSFEPADVAEQIQIFHADRFRALAFPQLSISALLQDSVSHAVPGSSADVLSFNGTSPHYLTTLILDQVLDCGAVHAPSASNSQQASAAAKHRASLLRHWTAIASYLLSFGDIAGWVAILAAICSRAVARLEQTWKFVAEGDRTLIASSWAPKLAKMKWNEESILPVEPALTMSSITSRQPKTSDARRPFCLPFLGDSFTKARRMYDARTTGPTVSCDSLPVASLAVDAPRLYQVLSKWQTEVVANEKPLGAETIAGINAPIVELQQMLQVCAAQVAANPRITVASYLEASLRLEPRSLGNVDLRWRPPLASSTAAKALLPLIFPEPLPNLDLLDRQEVVNAATASSPESGRNTSMSTSSSRQDFDATIKANKYVRSPLSGTPLMRASIQSLARSKTYPPVVGSRNSRTVPFSEITEWGTAALKAEETLFCVGSDLVLLAVGEPPASMPSSPMTSKRFSQELSRGSRPVSQVSKRSSLPASNRSSYVESVPPVHVVVKAATLERLVDVLVLGVSDLTVSPSSDDNSEAPLQTARRPRAVMDVHAYRTTFLATYRSICSPIVLFEFLRKRFLAAINAAREMHGTPHNVNASRFPSWSLIDTSASGNVEPVDWEFVGRVRHGIIAVLKLWVYHFTQDFTDDADLYAGLVGFNDEVQGNAELGRPDGLAEGDATPKVGLALQEVVNALRERCMKVNARRRTLPLGRAQSGAKSPSDSNPGPGSNPGAGLDFDAATPAQLVEYMECVATVFFDKITERDLLIVAEVFDRQAQEPLGWQVPRDPGAAEAQIIAMYKLLEHLFPSQHQQQRQPTRQTSDSVYHRLPATVRDACAAQSLLRGWIAVHIIEARIGVERRQARLEKLIDAVWLCRARMLNARTEESTTTPLAAPAPFEDATIGSYVESVIVGSLTASESRTFVRAWQGVCHARGGTGEGLNDLLPSKTDLPSLNNAALSGMATPDIGWLLRCIAQAVSRKSPLVQTNSTLLDFERSAIVHNLIESSLSVKQDAILPAVAELAGARLNAMQTTLRSVLWDSRVFKEDAAQEAMSVPPLPSKTSYRAYRPLQKIVQEQSEKQQRDRAAYDSLIQAAREMADRSASANAARAMSPTWTGGAGSGSSRSPLLGPQSIVGRVSTSSNASGGPPSSSSAAEKRSRRVTALFRGAVRQTGLMGGSGGDKLERAEQQVPKSYNELLNAVTTSQKPALTVGLAGSQVVPWNNVQRSWIFHLTAQDGSHLLLQASSQTEYNEWLSQLDKTIKLLPAPAAKSSDGKKSAQFTRGAKPSTFVSLYETDISQLVEREGRPIPLGLENMLSEIEARGLKEQGIYRISGAKSSIEALKQAYSLQSADSIDLAKSEFSDVHTIAGGVKMWYRDLPNPAIPFASYHRMMDAVAIENHDDRLYAIRDAIWDFPKIHFDLLRRTSEHLSRVAEEGEINLMLPHNLGLVFGTSLLRPPPSPSAMSESFANLGKAAHVVKLILTYHDWLFEPEPEPEPEAEAEAEGDSAGVQGSEDDAIDVTPHVLTGEVSTVVEEPEEDSEHEEAVDVDAGTTDDASTQTEKLLAEVQEAGRQHSAAAPPVNLSVAAVRNESSLSSTPSTATEVFLTDDEGEPAVTGKGSAPTPDQVLLAPTRSLSIADASSSGHAILRPENANASRHTGREESVYADALEVALDSPAANLFARTSLLPDEAMLDIIRLMGANGEADLDFDDA